MELRAIKAIPILEVAVSLGLQIKGRSARCFAHFPDRNPSLHFNIGKNTFHCYVCPRIGGSVIDLVMQTLNVPFRDAVNYLSGSATVTKRAERGRASHDPSLGVEDKDEILRALLAEAPLEKEGARYLTGRGIGLDVARGMDIGYLRPEEYRSLFWRMSRRFGSGRLKAAGLSRFYLFAKEGLGFLLFPYRLDGRVHLLKGRCVLTKEEAKERRVRRFVTTERAGIFYNQEALKGAGTIFLCEGEVDTLTLLQVGYPAVGIPGTGSFNQRWFDLLAGKRVVLSLDSDRAGKEASVYLSEEFEKRGIAHLKLDLAHGKDVNDCYLERR
ncbi:toprim domain-containing protein [Candidatus Manganitrophus noduliformans]|nr:toprim domain-containing protein [Candidatus Manganitrophus noduliformans]